MKLGIVGLPNVGKSTLFNCLTKGAKAESANYPFCTIEPNVGIVLVPDERLEILQKMYSSEKIVPAVIEFVDIAGLVKGASKGEGLGNKFLSHIREVDAIVHVVRCFEDANIIHVENTVDPIRDVEIIDIELILSDLESVDKRLGKGGKAKLASKEIEILQKLKTHLEDGKSARELTFDNDDLKFVAELNLLTTKPVLYACNVIEDDLADEAVNNQHVNKIREFAKIQNASVFVVCAKIEEEIADLSQEEKEMFLEELGIKHSGLELLIESSYSLLGLISYITAGQVEVRAWTIAKGTKAPQAAGKIHTDFEKGFIRAETVKYTDLVECGNLVSAKEKGLVRSEGKEYVVCDGDIILFRFNV